MCYIILFLLISINAGNKEGEPLVSESLLYHELILAESSEDCKNNSLQALSILFNDCFYMLFGMACFGCCSVRVGELGFHVERVEVRYSE